MAPRRATTDKTTSLFHRKPDPDTVYVCISSFFGAEVVHAGTKLLGSDPIVKLHWQLFTPDVDDRSLSAASDEFAARISGDTQARLERDEAARQRDDEKRQADARRTDPLTNPWQDRPSALIA